MRIGKKAFQSSLLSLQVKEYLIEQIMDGKYMSFNRLPAEDVMAEELGVSRLTLRSALASLGKEGVLLRRRGVGTLINRKVLRLKARIDYEVDFSTMLANYGYQVEVRTLSIDYHVLDPALCEQLNCATNEDMVRIKKLWLADGKPAILAIDSIPTRIVKRPISDQLKQAEVFRVLVECCDQEVLYSVSQFWPDTLAALEEDNQRIFGVQPESPMLILEEVGYNQENIPILFSREIYLNNIIKFSLVRTKV